MSQVSRRSEIGYINGAPSTPGCLLALREFSHVPQGLTEIAEAKQVRKTNQTGILYQFKKKGPKIVPHVSNLVDFFFKGFRSGSGPLLTWFWAVVVWP